MVVLTILQTMTENWLFDNCTSYLLKFLENNKNPLILNG